MDSDERARMDLWRDIDAFLAGARRVRPLRPGDALLDLSALAAGGQGALLPRLAAALDGWQGKLLATADEAIAPVVCAGDQVVIDPQGDPGDGDIVVAYAGAGLLVRRLAYRGGGQWLEGGDGPAIPLGPLVALLGVAIEVRRPLACGARLARAAGGAG